MFDVDSLVSTLPLGCVNERLLVLHDHPVGRLHPILVLHLILAAFFGHAWKLKEVDGVDVQLGDQVGIYGRFGSHRQICNHLFGVENHLVGASHD